MTIYMNITEAGGIKNKTLQVTNPLSSTVNVPLNILGQVQDTYMYYGNFTDTLISGVYTIYAESYDQSDNFDNATGAFEVRSTVVFAGIARNNENPDKPGIPVTFSFYRDGESSAMHTVVSNETTGYYNESIYAEQYDIDISAFGHLLKFTDSTISEDYYNPVTFGEIHPSIIAKDALEGLWFDSILPSSSTNLVFDYAPYADAAYPTSNLTVYYCTNWTVLVGCKTPWTKMNGTLDLLAQSYSIRTMAFPSAYVFANRLCGNSECDTDFGETLENCVEDCAPSTEGGGGTTGPTPTYPVFGGGAGGAGDGGAGGAGGEAVNLTLLDLSKNPVEIKSTLLYVTLYPGEHEIHSIEIMNNLNVTVKTALSVEGVAWDMIDLQKTSFDIGPVSTEIVKVELSAPISAAAGTYTADIITRTGSVTHRTPVTIKIEIPKEPLLDILLDLLSKSVAPGDNLKFQTTLKNMGDTAEVDDITITYNVKNMETGNITLTEQETVAVEQTTSFTKTIAIPNSTDTGRYILEANASYWDGRRYAVAAAAFDVSTLPKPLVLLKSIFMNWLTYVILLVIIPLVYGSRKLYQMYLLKKAQAARYIFPMDYKKLPQAGENTIRVGKIAETDVPAYIDVNNLTMHSIAAGGTGSGKSVCAMSTAEELLKRKIPVVVFDPTAQWTGFIKPCKDPKMLSLYPRFGLKPEDARSFKTNIIMV
ncbi:MAG: DUF87 domain-containing protein, partial [Candidatus Aenigmarchaeota archaeon]|nr:DUF87 domain-containing protein [Candidatus Aenigmarchaeota archaeon]